MGIKSRISLPYDAQCKKYDAQCKKYDAQCKKYDAQCKKYDAQCKKYDAQCKKYDAQCKKKAFMPYVNSNGLEEREHPCSLIWTISVC